MKQRTIEQLELIYFKLIERKKTRGRIGFIYINALSQINKLFCNRVSDMIGLKDTYSNLDVEKLIEYSVVEVNINNRYYTFILRANFSTENANLCFDIKKRGPVRTMFVRNNGLVEY